MSDTQTPAEFLLARIAEDEAAARDAALAPRPRGGWGAEGSPTGERWETRDRSSGMLYVPEIENPADAALWDDEGGCDFMAPARPAGIHIARHDPARVLAECRAKRLILGQVYDLDGGFDGYTEGTRDAVMQLAAVYAGHPDYDPAWQPEQDYTRPHDSPGGQDEHPSTKP